MYKILFEKILINNILYESNILLINLRILISTYIYIPYSKLRFNVLK